MLRLGLLSSGTFLLFLLWLLTRSLRLVSRSLALRSHFWVVRLWGRLCCRIMGVRVHFEGRPPEPPYFLVANHLSYLDIVVLYSEVEGYFLAKSEVASWPVLGWLASTTGTLYVNRSRKSDLKRVVPLVQERMSSGHGVIIFPEGTSTRGSAIERFKPSLFEVPVQTGHPVRTAALSYRTPEGTPHPELSVCWWGDMGFAEHALCLLTMPSIEAHVRFGDEPLLGEDRKELAQRAQDAVAALFEPVRHIEHSPSATGGSAPS